MEQLAICDQQFRLYGKILSSAGTGGVNQNFLQLLHSVEKDRDSFHAIRQQTNVEYPYLTHIFEYDLWGDTRQSTLVEQGFDKQKHYQ